MYEKVRVYFWICHFIFETTQWRWEDERMKDDDLNVLGVGGE